MKKFFTTTVMLLMVLASQATIRYVRTMYPSQNLTGTKWQNAGTDLQGTINASSAGDEVWVLSGPYWPIYRPDGGAYVFRDRNNAFLLKAGVKIYGSFSGTETLLSQRTAAVIAANPSILTGDLKTDIGGSANNLENAFHVVVSAGDVGSATLDGFTIKGGNANAKAGITVNTYLVEPLNGGGMYIVNSSPFLANIIFTGNVAIQDGGGLFNKNSSTTCRNCTFTGNAAGLGGGLHNYTSSPLFTNCVFSANISYNDGGSGINNYMSSAVFTNIVVSGNQGIGVGNYESAQAVFTNATISGNSDWGMYNYNSNIKLRNSIIYGNSRGIGGGTIGINTIVEYSLIQELSATDPQFTSPVSYTAAPTTAGNYTLTLCSPAISKGSNTYYATGQTPNLTAVTTDIAGNSRNYNNGVVDMGAYEAQLDPGIFYVKPGATGNGYSWATASGDIQAMVNLVCTGTSGQVWVAGGTYKPNRRADATGTITPADRNNAFVLRNNVQVYGGFAGTETLLSQRTAAVIAANPSTLSGDFSGNDGANFANNTENAYHVVVSAGAVGTATLDGFTIKGGNATGASTINVNTTAVAQTNGGGMYTATSSPVLANISYTANKATNGGGLYNNGSSPAFTNCMFIGNAAANGAGINNVNSPAIFTNTMVSGNKSSGNGGGAYNEGSPAVYTNATISGNAAAKGAGIYSISSPAVFTNVVVSGNKSSGNGGGVYNEGSQSIFTNATISGNMAGSGSGMYNATSSNIKLRNSIIYGNLDGILNSSSTPIIEYSLVQELYATDQGNVNGDTDPQFTSPASYADAPTTAGSYNLSYCSPVTNIGSNAYYGVGQTPNLTAVTTDLAGNSRFYNSGVVDMGAYELQAANNRPVLYVKAGGTGDGFSWATASGDIQAMINLACPSGSTQIWVAGGTYKPNRRAENLGTITPADRNNAFVLKGNVKVYGGFAGTETLLSQRDLTLIANASTLSGDFSGNDVGFANNNENAYHVVVSAGPVFLAELNGFTITKGNANGTDYINVAGYQGNGGGMYAANGSPILANISFTSNSAITFGGGLYNEEASTKCNNCTFTTNKAVADGGGVYNYMFTYQYNDSPSPVFTNCVFSGNIASNGAGIVNFNSAAIFTNIVVSGNKSTTYGGGVFNSGSRAVFTNATISGNSASSGGGCIYNSFSSNIRLRNSIIYGNMDGMVNVTTSTPTIEYCLIQGLAASGTGNIGGTTDPQFTSAVAYAAAPTTLGNYSLSVCSPVTNVGSNAYYAAGQIPNLTAVTTDVVGNSRMYSSGVADMGAYELQATAIPPVLYVKAGGTGNGFSWAAASGDIQAMINMVYLACPNSPSQIWVAGGTYKPNRRADSVGTITPADRNNAFVLSNNVQVYGSFAGTETLLSQRTTAVMAANPSTLSGDFSGNDAGFTNNDENAYHVVVSAGAVGTATLDGFTIKGGNTKGNTGAINVNAIVVGQGNGGGMISATSSPFLANIIFTANYASTGGGLYNNSSSSVITNCVFSGNSAILGAGIFSISSPAVFTNILVSGNKSTNFGGGIYIGESSAAVFTNATITGNSASSGGGMFNFNNATNLQLRNSIIYGNSSGIANVLGSTTTIEHSMVQELAASAPGNLDGITTDPQFTSPVAYTDAPTTAGNYGIGTCSPLINAGSNSYYTVGLTPDLSAITTDVVGYGRFYGGGMVDMGAYEQQVNTTGTTLANAGDISTTSVAAGNSYPITASGAICRILATIIAQGTSPVTGSVNANVWIETNQPTTYVKRHYQITPATNASTATATVTLYFAQQEFTDFNALNSTKLPIDATDAANNKAHLLIEKHSGISSDGSGLPATYPAGSATSITPTSVSWNATASRWEVTFNTVGFSGFFVKTQSAVLPVTLVSFTANLVGNRTVALQWNVAEQVGIKNYLVERSTDGNSFSPIGSIAANSLSATSYSYADVNLPVAATVYYRLRIVGVDGTVTYSSIVTVKLGGSNLISIYPNPAKDYVWLQGGGVNLIGTYAFVTDMQGRIVSKTLISAWPLRVNTSSLSDGVYLIRLDDNQTLKLVVER